MAGRAAWWYRQVWADLKPGTQRWRVEQFLAELSGAPEDARRLGNRWYRVYADEADWYEAKEQCRQRGGHLVYCPRNRLTIRRESV